MNVRFYILTILLMSSLLASSAKEVNSVSYMDFTDGANEVEEYAYDANGNMTMDLNRGIESITYDWNNMPREITFTSGAKTRYTYDAAGRKLRAEYITPLTAQANYALGPTPPIVPPLTLYDLSSVDYHGDCVLRNDSLERVLTPNGYIASDTLHYYIKDYQGNVRSVVRQDGTLVESNEYYPYGGLFSATASAQPYKYSSKELDRTHGLDLYDSEARWYDSLLGRTSTMDPLAEKYYSLSPYTWCAGNPVRFIDPDGRIIILPKGMSKKNIYIVLGYMQKLTNDRIVYSTQKDGRIRVKIASLGSGSKVSGTNLIRRLNSSNKTLTIDVQNSLGHFSKSKGNRAKATNYLAASNGVGSDAIVNFDPNSNPRIKAVNSETGVVSAEYRPLQIGLSHELIHAEHYMDGDYIPSTSTSKYTYKINSEITITQSCKTEELRTVGLVGVKKDDITENQIREEQNINLRGAY